MGLNGQTLIATGSAWMGRDVLAAQEDLHRVRREARIDALADQRVMDRVVRAANFDVMILVYSRADFPLGILVPAQWQRLRRRPLLSFEHAVPAAIALLEGFRVDRGDDLVDGAVQLGQTEELAVAQGPEHASLGNEHSIFHSGFITRFFYP